MTLFHSHAFKYIIFKEIKNSLIFALGMFVTWKLLFYQYYEEI